MAEQTIADYGHTFSLRPNYLGGCYTYEEALKNAQEVLELLVEEYQEDGKPLPEPKTLEQLTFLSEASKQPIA